MTGVLDLLDLKIMSLDGVMISPVEGRHALLPRRLLVATVKIQIPEPWGTSEDVTRAG